MRLIACRLVILFVLRLRMTRLLNLQQTKLLRTSLELLSSESGECYLAIDFECEPIR
jgi:hypothetical protein